MLAALNALNEIQNESENQQQQHHHHSSSHHENELYAEQQSYKGAPPPSMQAQQQQQQNNIIDQIHENSSSNSSHSIKREPYATGSGLDGGGDVVIKQEDSLINYRKGEYKNPNIPSYELGHQPMDQSGGPMSMQQQHRAASHNNNYGFMHHHQQQHHHHHSIAEQEKTNFRQQQQHTTNYESHYMNCQAQQQQQQQQQPKMQMSNPVPQQQQSMPRYHQPPPVDDPYNFVDEEDSLSKPPPGLGMGGGGGPQMPPHMMMGNGPPPGHHPGYAGYPPHAAMMEQYGPGIGPGGNQQLPVPGQPQQPVQEKTAKKRGRKKKGDEISGTSNGMSGSNGDPNVIPRVPKERKKHDRFNGMPEAEVIQRTLPDHLHDNLDIVIIGINPGLFAAYKGHHYAGPGNHFWKCLYLSGLTPEQMTAEEDYKLLNLGIGFTNMVARPTKGSADLTRKEIKEGSLILLEKLKRFKPKIAVFNGKLIFEVFSGKKDFNFGKQAETIDGTNTYMWVMPSSSARCAQLPRAADKVPFYAALKKFRDYLCGHLEHLDESEVVFDDPKYKNCVESDKHPIEFAAFGPDGLPLPPPEDGKKKRGRPKKNKIVLNENGEPVQVKNERPRPAEVPQGPVDPSKKKRGRPKKVKGDISVSHTSASVAPATVPTPAATPNGGSQMLGPQNTPPNGAPTPTPAPNGRPPTQQNSQPPPQTHFNSPNNFNMMHNPVDTLTPPPSVGYQQNMNFNGAIQSGAAIKAHPGYQQSPQPHSQGYPHSDVGSDGMSSSGAQLSGGEHMSNSPATVTSPVDFGRSSSDNTQQEQCRFSSPASTISEQQSQQMQVQHMHSMQQAQQRQHQGTPDMNYPSPYCTPQHPGSAREGANTPQFSNYNNDHSLSYQKQSPHANFGVNTNFPRNSPHHVTSKTPTPHTKEVNCNDVATKSLSGLESLVDQIPTDAERLSAANPGEYVKSETLTESVLNQYQPAGGGDYNTYTSSNFSSSPYGSSTNHYNQSGGYNMSSPFSVNNLLTNSNSYPPPMNSYPGKPPPPPPGAHHLGPTNAHLFMPEPPHMPVPHMFAPYQQQNPYPTYPAASPHPSLLQPSYPYPSPYSNPGFSSHHMFDRF